MEDQAYQRITQKVQDLVPKVQKFAKDVKSVIGIVGATGSGKSTVISYFINSTIMKHTKLWGGIYQIEHNDTTGKYPKIGHQMISCTSIPAIYEINGQSYVDLSGWFDTGDSSQEIINSYTNSSVFKRGKSVKIILIVEINSIFASRGGNLVQIIMRLSQFFGQDLSLMIDSIMLVISKVNTNQCPLQFITGEILKIIQSNKSFNDISKILLKTIIKNQMLMIFPQPDKITNHIDLIKNKIKNAKATILTHDGKISLSNSAKNDVNRYLGTLNKNIGLCADKVSFDIRNTFGNKIFLNGNQVNSDLNKLKKVEIVLKSQIIKFASAGVQNEANFLEQIISNIPVSVQTTKILRNNFNMVTFYKKLNGEVNIELCFNEKVSVAIAQNIGRLEIIREKLSSEEQRKKQDEQHKKQMKQRQQRNLELIQQSQNKMFQLAKQNDAKIQQQRKQYMQQMKRQGQQHMKQISLMNEQLTQLRNRKPQVIYQDGGGWCQIM